jgi:hypothetical protein
MSQMADEIQNAAPRMSARVQAMSQKPKHCESESGALSSLCFTGQADPNRD